MRNKRGFTLVEVLGVIVVIGLISFLIVPKVANTIFNSKEVAYKTQVETIENAARKYGIENDLLYPKEGEKKYIAVKDLVSVGQLSNKEIINPKTGNEMSGYVEVKYNIDYQQYEYNYVEDVEGDIVSAMGPTYEVSDQNKWTTSKNVTIVFPQGDDYVYEYRIIEGTVTKDEQVLTPSEEKWYSSNDLRTTLVFHSNGSLVARVKSDNEYKYGNTLNVSYIDNTVPKVTLGYDEENSTSNKTILVASCTDNESGILKYEFSKDGSNWIDNDTKNTYTFSDLNNSTEYTFSVRCTNGSGMTKIGTSGITTSDINGPTFIVSNPEVWKTNKNVTIKYPENYTKYEFNVLEGKATMDGQELTNGTWYRTENLNQVLNFVSNGSIAARVYDGVNLGPIGNQTISKVDATVPTCSIVYSGGTLGTNGYYKVAPSIKFSTSVAGPSGLTFGVSKTNSETYDHSVNEGTLESGIINVTNISEGVNNYYGFVKTGASNTDTCQNTLFLDTVSPTIALNGNASLRYINNSSTLTIPIKVTDVTSGIDSSSLTESDITVRVDGTIVSPTKTLTYNSVSNGVYSYTLTLTNVTENGELTISVPSSAVTDKAGNASTAQTLTPNVTVDNLSPTLSVSVSNGTTYSKSNSATISLKDSGGSGLLAGTYIIKYAWGTSAVACSNMSSTTNIVVSSGDTNKTASVTINDKTGAGKIYVCNSTLVKDNAGNSLAANTVKSADMYLDNSAPTIQITPNGGNYTIPVGSTSIDVSSKIDVTDANSDVNTIKYAWSTSNQTSPTTFTSITNGASTTKSLTGGDNYLWFVSTDKASNEKTFTSSSFNVGYAVEYDANGGSTTCSSQRKIHNTNLTLCSTAPTKEGYTFLGWSESNTSTSGTYKASGTYSKNKSVKLYAIWQKTLTATFNKNGATEIGSESLTCNLYNNATSCTVTAPTITRSGFEIIGWSTSSSSQTGTEVGKTLTLTANTTYNAITHKNVTITFNRNGATSQTPKGGSANTEDTLTQSCDIWNSATTCSITSPTITASTNTPTVVGYATSASATTSSWNHNTVKNVNSNATYYAITKKDAITYNATFNIQNSSSATSSATSASCTIAATYNGSKQGTSCTTTAPKLTASTNYTAYGWNTNNKATTATIASEGSITLSSNSTYYSIVSKPISKLTITLGTSSYDYDGTEKTPSVTVKDGSTTLTKDTDYTIAYSDNTNAGTAKVTITSKKVYNSTTKIFYTDSDIKNFTINKIANPISVKANTLTYNGSAQSLVTVSGAQGNVCYSTSAAVTSCSSAGTIPKGTNAGTYTIYYYVAGNANYKLASGSVSVTISKKSVAVIWGSTTTFTYNGSAQAPTASATSGVTGETINVTRTTGTNAGSYTSTASCSSVTGGQALCSNYTLTGTTKAFTINKASSTNPTLTAYEGTYDGASHTFTISGGAGGTVQYSTDGGTTWGTTKPTRTVAGTTTVHVRILGDVNHNNTTAISTTIKIKQRATTVTSASASKTYDGSALTKASGCASATNLVSGDTATCTNTGTIKNAGSATNTLSSVVIKNASGTDVTSNYTVTKANGTLTISKKSVAVIWGSTTTFTYNGSAQAPTASATSGVTGETINVTRTTGKNAGSYTSTASCSSVTGGQALCSNYTLTGTTKAFTINKASSTNPTLTAYEGTYDGASHTFTISGGAGGTVQYSTDGGTTWGTTKPTRTVAGTTTVHVRILGDVNHNNTTAISTTIKIKQRATTVTSASASKTYDGSALTKASGCASATNLVSGDTATCTNTGTIKNAGSATNTLSSVVIKNASGTDVTSNYTVTKANGTLTISKKSVAVIWGSTTTFTYNGSAQAPTASATSGVTGETINVTRTTGTNAGSYTSKASCSSVTGGQALCSNYTLTGNTKAFTINKKSVAVTWGSTTTFTYSGSTQAPTASATSGITGETINVTRTTGTNAGSYTSTASCSSVTGGQALCSNYTLTGNTKAFTINPKPATLTLSATSSGYFNSTTTFTETANVAGTFTNTSGSTSYATVSPANYSNVAANTAKTVTVTAVATGNSTITVTFTPTSSNYSAVTKTYTAQVDKTAPSVPTSVIRYDSSSGEVRGNSSAWTNRTLWWGNFSSTDSNSGINHYEFSNGCTGSKSDNLVESYTYSSNTNYTFCIRSVDNAGNTSDWSSAYYFRIDKTTPTAPTLTGGSSSWTNSNKTISVSSAGTAGPSGIRNYQYRVQNYLYGGYASSKYSLNDFSQSGTKFTTTGSDAYIHFGNLGSAYITGVEVYLNSALTSNLTFQLYYATSNGAYSESNSVISTIPSGSTQFYVNIPDGNYESLRYDFGGVSGVTFDIKYILYLNDGTTSNTTTISGNGDNRVYYKTVSNSGMISDWSSSQVVLLDKIAPTCGSFSGESTSWTNSNRTISVSCSDAGGSACTANTYNVATYSSGTTKTANLSYTIRDKAGNTATCTKNSANIYVDKQGPSTPSITLKYGTASTSDNSVGGTYTSGSWTKYDVRTTAESTDSGSGIAYYEYSHDGSSWTGDITNLGWNYTYYSDSTTKTKLNYWIYWGGQWNFYVRAVDNLGNVSSASSMFTERIDKTAPSYQHYTSAGNSSNSGVDGVMTTPASGTCAINVWFKGYDNLSGLTANGSLSSAYKASKSVVTVKFNGTSMTNYNLVYPGLGTTANIYRLDFQPRSNQVKSGYNNTITITIAKDTLADKAGNKSVTKTFNFSKVRCYSPTS